MKILIDADGCPVVDLTIKIANQYQIECIVICDTSHIFNVSAKVITVDKGTDSVDFKLANMINKGDIAVTQDYGLAAMCLAKSGYAINQNGLEYNDDNISLLLETRALAKKIRRSGGRLKGPKKRSTSNNDTFEKSLTNLINKAKQKEDSI